MLLILRCCDHTFWAPSLVCPFWSVCIWVLSVVTLRNWLCWNCGAIVAMLERLRSLRTWSKLWKGKKKKLWPCSQGVTEGASVVSGQSLLSLDRSYCVTWYRTGVNRCRHGPRLSSHNSLRRGKEDANLFNSIWDRGGFMSVVFK